MLGEHEARLRYMLTVPGLYGFDARDVAAIEWTLKLLDSAESERKAIAHERANMHRYYYAVHEMTDKLRAIEL